MSKNDIGLDPLTEFEAMPVTNEFKPDLIQRLGYHLGWLSGEALNRPAEKFEYKAQISVAKVTWEMFPAPRAAITVAAFPTAPEMHSYSNDFMDWMMLASNRFVMVTAPVDGEFTVLFAQSHPNGSDTVHDRVYNYEKAYRDYGGSFNQLALDIVNYLTKGETALT